MATSGPLFLLSVSIPPICFVLSVFVLSSSSQYSISCSDHASRILHYRIPCLCLGSPFHLPSISLLLETTARTNTKSKSTRLDEANIVDAGTFALPWLTSLGFTLFSPPILFHPFSLLFLNRGMYAVTGEKRDDDEGVQ